MQMRLHFNKTIIHQHESITQRSMPRNPLESASPKCQSSPVSLFWKTSLAPLLPVALIPSDDNIHLCPLFWQGVFLGASLRADTWDTFSLFLSLCQEGGDGIAYLLHGSRMAQTDENAPLVRESGKMIDPPHLLKWGKPCTGTTKAKFSVSTNIS